jgi:hypothetical protein
MKRWEVAYVGEVIDLEDFKAKKAEIDGKRASIEQELTRLDEQQRFLEQSELETTALEEWCRRVRKNLPQYDTNENKRGALQALNITVTWYPDKPLTIKGSIEPDIASNAGR